jgi:hypothetical protein
MKRWPVDAGGLPGPTENGTDAKPGSRAEVRGTVLFQGDGKTVAPTVTDMEKTSLGPVTAGSSVSREVEKIRSGMEKLFEMAGTDDVSKILDKISSSQKLNESLTEQSRDYEVRSGSNRWTSRHPLICCG